MRTVVLAMAVAGALAAGAANAQSGADVVKSKGCVNCHEMDKKKVGPSFKDIAAKGKGKEAKLCHMGHIMTENRHGLIVDARLTEANGTAECSTALDMIDDNAGARSTLGADKNYDTADFVAGCRARGCVPHVAQNDTNRRSAIDARTTRHPGYAISMVKRKRIEEPFG